MNFQCHRVVIVLEIREKLGEMENGENNQGILSGCLNIKVLPLLRFNLMISGSAKMRYQEVRENYLRSGRSQERVRENESGKTWPPYASSTINKYQSIKKKKKTEQENTFLVVIICQTLKVNCRSKNNVISVTSKGINNYLLIRSFLGSNVHFIYH